MTKPQVVTANPHTGAQAALADLCAGWFDAGPAVVVAPDEVPEPFNRLLVHYEHMTLILEHFYQRAVCLHVRRAESGPDVYRRLMVLTAGIEGPVVEAGIARLHLDLVPPVVRSEILAQQMPLGAILVRHNVLRNIKIRWLLRVAPDNPALAACGVAPPHEVYGRIGTIYCNHQPAIELLEIVTGIQEKP